MSDLNLRLSLYQRMAAADAEDAATDLERELNDRFGAPPPAVRNLLYIVRVRSLAKAANIGAIAREERADGRNVLILRTQNDAEITAEMPLGARRELERTDGISVGRSQLRIDIGLLGDAWREELVLALEALAARAPVAAA